MNALTIKENTLFGFTTLDSNHMQAIDGGSDGCVFRWIGGARTIQRVDFSLTQEAKALRTGSAQGF